MDTNLPVFINPMQVEIDGMGRYRKAETVQDLAGMLLSEQWHHKHGSKFHGALMLSIEALEFYVDAKAARAAFVDAAHEAGMHVLPDDATEKKPVNLVAKARQSQLPQV